ncbi:phosphopantothenoylcysteine decarboxylase/phosphopantothenate/cysteine ligase [Candidatus Magnetoovum chiemensis]|nr:phosphopantothenoylcysteine decarboxylase/phosphopantothenate/cysteine ligase [Candidatus Magnetoovum chiemensis]
MADEKYILLGITGGIAAYKTAQLIRDLKQEGYNVKVVMTKAAKKFITPLTLEIVSENEVLWDTFQSPLSHIELAKNAQAFIIAPATLNTISKLACGIADNLLTNLFMSFTGPVLIAPSMNSRMFENKIFQENLSHLKEKGIIEIKCETGYLACGETGIGKMASLDTIKEELKKALTKQDMKDLKVLISCGPTREYIDAVRFISNRSSGKMGQALAKSAYYRGASVSMVSGPSTLKAPNCIETTNVETSLEMEKALTDKIKETDILIMAAAVADYKADKQNHDKMERLDSLTINLTKTSDIVAGLSSQKGSKFIVGFAAEMGNKIARAKEKLQKKRLDMIIFNNIASEGAGFDTDTNIVTIITEKEEIALPKMYKFDVANTIYDKILEIKNQ